jgi:methyl-accepting chemotaxis protein
VVFEVRKLAEDSQTVAGEINVLSQSSVAVAEEVNGQGAQLQSAMSFFTVDAANHLLAEPPGAECLRIPLDDGAATP